MRILKNKTLAQTRTYNSWTSMKTRCFNENHIDFSHYGARGITVCNRWLIFANFLEDMGERPVGMTLDRIETNGHYEPANCRWSNLKTQNRNRRNNRFVEYGGVKMTVAEVAEKLGVYDQALARRIKLGWPEADWGKPMRRRSPETKPRKQRAKETKPRKQPHGYIAQAYV